MEREPPRILWWLLLGFVVAGLTIAVGVAAFVLAVLR